MVDEFDAREPRKLVGRLDDFVDARAVPQRAGDRADEFGHGERRLRRGQPVRCEQAIGKLLELDAIARMRAFGDELVELATAEAMLCRARLPVLAQLRQVDLLLCLPRSERRDAGGSEPLQRRTVALAATRKAPANRPIFGQSGGERRTSEAGSSPVSPIPQSAWLRRCLRTCPKLGVIRAVRRPYLGQTHEAPVDAGGRVWTGSRSPPKRARVRGRHTERAAVQRWLLLDDQTPRRTYDGEQLADRTGVGGRRRPNGQPCRRRRRQRRRPRHPGSTRTSQHTSRRRRHRLEPRSRVGQCRAARAVLSFAASPTMRATLSGA
jgi:hypothetical protein